MLTLFGDIEEMTAVEKRESLAAERRRKARLAYQNTSAAWKRSTYDFAVNTFLPDTRDFLFEDLSNAYEEYAKRHGKPLSVQKKAFAGLQRMLVAEGKIELIKGVTRIRSNSQEGKVYRSNLYGS